MTRERPVRPAANEDQSKVLVRSPTMSTHGIYSLQGALDPFAVTRSFDFAQNKASTADLAPNQTDSDISKSHSKPSKTHPLPQLRDLQSALAAGPKRFRRLQVH